MRRFVQSMLLLVVASIVIPVLLVAYVYARTAPYRSTSIEHLPDERVAIVFGAAVRPDKTPSDMLRDRVEGGVELYKENKVQKLLMSGDNSSSDYNEVAVMKAVAEAMGVPSTDIIEDFAGLSTYETCYRAKVIFGVQHAILVTQSYHQPRAIFTCRNVGVEAFGYALPDFSKYPDQRRKLLVREYLATAKAVLDVKVFKPEPKYLGKFEGPI